MGRPPGAKNTISHNTKSNIETVFDLLGGTQGMYQWARENPGAFYQSIYAKLLPRNIEARVEVQSLEDLVAASAQVVDLIIEDDNVIALPSRDETESD